MTREPKDEPRMQFSWWLRADLGERFLSYVERQGPKVKQREVAEKAIEAYLDRVDPKPQQETPP